MNNVATTNTTAALMEYQIRAKTPLASYLLWFFFGMLGAHNFYLGRTKQAVWQLVLTLLVVTSVVTAVWALVDLFRIRGFLAQHNGAVATDLRQRYGADALGGIAA